VPGEEVPSVRHGLPVGVQITLRCCQGAVAGDLSECVHRHTGVGHPGHARMPQAVALQVLVAKLSDAFVPQGGVAQRGGGYTSASRAGGDVEGACATEDSPPIGLCLRITGAFLSAPRPPRRSYCVL
jgi:hypothetical protein